jgi:hypothetical protein
MTSYTSLIEAVYDVIHFGGFMENKGRPIVPTPHDLEFIWAMLRPVLEQWYVKGRLEQAAISVALALAESDASVFGFGNDVY